MDFRDGGLYTADGKIKTRGVAGGDAVPIEFIASIRSRAHPTRPRCATSIRAARRPVRGITAPVISPDGPRSRSSRSVTCG